jgi:acetyl/propionyl-CoA carboxylase alpha subunit
LRILHDSSCDVRHDLGEMKRHYIVRLADGDSEVELERLGPDHLRVSSAEESVELSLSELGPGQYLLKQGQEIHDLLVVGQSPDFTVLGREGSSRITLLDEHQVAMAERAGYGAHRAGGVIAVRAPMPGKVVKTLVSEGDVVAEGQGVIVVEAMKMENELKCPADGTVKQILVAQGERVEANQNLVLIE